MKYTFIATSTSDNPKLLQRLIKIGEFLAEKGYHLHTRNDNPLEALLIEGASNKQGEKRLLKRGVSHFPFDPAIDTLVHTYYPNIFNLTLLQISDKIRHLELGVGSLFVLHYSERSDDDLDVLIRYAEASSIPCFNLADPDPLPFALFLKGL